MMERRIFLWMGHAVLFLSFVWCGAVHANISHTVKKGETLASIAQKYHVDTKSLQRENRLQTPQLRVGQVLVVPSSTVAKSGEKKSPHLTATYTVKKGDSLSCIAKKHGMTVAQLKQLNHLKSPKLSVGKRLLVKKSLPTKVEPQAPQTTGSEVSDLLDEEEDEELDDGTSVIVNEKWLAEQSAPLGKWHSPYERSLFVKVVKSFLGAPYRFGGDSLRGLDCSAFVRRIYQIFDVHLPRTAYEQAQVGVKVEREELKEGDLVFFNTRRPYGHVGIYIGNNQFIHASSSRGERQVKIDSLDKPYYSKRFIKAVRLMEVTKGDDTT